MSQQSRREFLQTGLAASALPLGLDGRYVARGTAERSSSDAARTSLTVYKVLFDRRFAPSVAFAFAAEALGVDTSGFDGDITDIWFRDLSLRWAREPAAVAGLTAHGPLFCLERWGWDHGLRVLYRAQHDRLEDGRALHAIHGPRSVVGCVREALRASGPWSRQLARPMTSCPRGEIEQISDDVVTPDGLEIDSDESLFSWVIAPYRQV